MRALLWYVLSLNVVESFLSRKFSQASSKVNRLACLTRIQRVGVVLALLVTMLSYAQCPSKLESTTNATAADGTQYKVQYHYFKSDGTPDFVDANGNGQWDSGEAYGTLFAPQWRVAWVRDATIHSHDLLVNPTYNFSQPYFSVKPNSVCVDDINFRGLAHGDRISIHDVNVLMSDEEFVRGIVIHELFHQVQNDYIDKNESVSWGQWAVEGTADYITDKLFLDVDGPLASNASAYLDSANQFLSLSDLTLFDHTYSAALFWNYLSEQFGTKFLEPARGVDFVQQFWSVTPNQSPSSVKILENLIAEKSANTTTLEEVFLDFAITNYTHKLDLTQLAGKYPDSDRPQRDYVDRFSYFDEGLNGGNTPYASVKVQTVADWNKEFTEPVERWAAKYLEIDPANLDLQGCEAIGFRGESEKGEKLSWALIGMKNGAVIDIARYSGSAFTSTFLNNPPGRYDKLAAVVVGLNTKAQFRYQFGAGDLDPAILSPNQNWLARAGKKDDPQRFTVRLQLTGPTALTPAGFGPPSVRGVDTSKLHMSLIGSKPYKADIINASYVGGEYRIVVQAPRITGVEGDLFDLEICLCEDDHNSCVNKVTSAKSVLYGEFNQNLVIALDRSGSMGWDGGLKFNAAVNAARLAVDAASDDSQVGLVTFWGWRDSSRECEDESTLVRSLVDVAPNRRDMIIAINNITIGDNTDGWTSLGDGLVAAAKQFLTVPPLDENAILLLSDGLPNRGLYWDIPNLSCGLMYSVEGLFSEGGPYHGTVIYPQGFGPDADMQLLNRMASATNGKAIHVRTDQPGSPLSNPLIMAVPNRLAEAFRRAQEDFGGLNRLYYNVINLNLPVPVNQEITIPISESAGGGVQDATFAFNWTDAASGVRIVLNDPSGKRVNDSLPNWSIVTEARTNVVYHYNGTLSPGTWRVQLFADNSSDQVLVMLSGRMIHGVDVSLEHSQLNEYGTDPECLPFRGRPYLRGLPVTILINANDSLGGIAHLRDVTAVITNFEASDNQISLFDDGMHGDSLPNDGIYANTFPRTPFYKSQVIGQDESSSGPIDQSAQTGNYTIFVNIKGENNWGESFERFVAQDFSVYEYPSDLTCANPDFDNDGLPDRWEMLVNLNAFDPADSEQDNDDDGLTNGDEFFFGTHPFNPDSDGGGQADGSEVNLSQDPLYEKDDAIFPIIDYGAVIEATDIPVHQPQAGVNILHFPADPSYRVMQIWRTDVVNPSWEDFMLINRVDLSESPRGVFYDSDVNSGVQYSYFLIAEGLNEGVMSAPTAFFSVLTQ